MKSQLKSIKVSLILGLLLGSIIIAMAPTSSAQDQGLFKFEPYLDLNILNTDATTGIVPANDSDTIIDLEIKLKIAGLLGRQAENLYSAYGVDAKIQVKLGEVPSYCSAYLLKQSTQVDVTQDFLSGDTISLAVRFLKEAPQGQTVNIPVIVKVPPTTAFPYSTTEVEETFTVPVTPAYIPLIDAYPKNDLLEVAPGEIAVFDIELENQGNQLTEFRFTDIRAPDGWVAAIISETKIDSAQVGGKNTRTVRLQVTPPYDFGYHDEIGQVKVEVKGYYFAGKTSSDPVELRVQVRNRGFSFQPGVEMAAIVVIIIVALVFLFLIRPRLKKK